MQLKIIADYVSLCQKYNKSITWHGLKLFKASLSK